MTEKSKKKFKKAKISEDDISILLQRYTAQTVLALLQEVAQFEGGVKIDWNALVKKSTTGISNAREYQMLWRHLSYRHSLLDKFQIGSQPLDDDSDLEYELQPFPAVSSEASAEASACVKVLIASGLTSDSSHHNSAMVEAPLTINIPNGQLVKATSESSQLPTLRGMNITVPVSVQKQPQPAMAASEAMDTNGSVNGTMPPRKRRKTWTEAEDLELVSAVQKYGEGNWATILRSEIKWDRTASQLSQRWTNLRKKVGNLNLATTSTTTTTTTTTTGGVQLSEAQRRERIEMNRALEAAVKSPFIKSGEGTSQYHSQRSFATKPSSTMQLGSAAKSQLTVNKPVKPDLNSDPVRAAAVAAGARIATQSDAASLLRAAQAKNAVHIMPTAGSSIKPVLPSSASSSHAEAHSNGSLNGHSAVSPSGLRPMEKASSQSTQHNPISGTAMHIVSSSSFTQANTEVASKQDIVHSGGTKSMGKVVVEEDRVCVAGKESSKHVKQEKAVLLKQETKTKSGDCSLKMDIVHQKQSVGGSLKGSPKTEVGEGSDTLNGEKMDCSSVEKDEKQCAGQGEGENKGNVTRSVADKCGEKLEKKDSGNALTRDDS